MSELKKLTEDIYSSDEEEDSDFFPEDVESEDDQDISDSDENSVSEDVSSDNVDSKDNSNNKKRSLEAEGNDSKRSRQESERKAKVDALWAEMNQNINNNNKNDPNKKLQQQQQHPLDDISSTANQTKDQDKSENESNKDDPSPRASPIQAKNKIQRPKSNLSSLVSQYNIKVPKMNTLDKSKLDWQGYVEREGIKEDLKYKNKDGYTEKVAFLQRVDDRRLNDLKQGQRQSKKQP
ncbi:bucentaur or craniofacial development-domain-containing protein [Cunninghamella echinulata]|nr:bucentaur or craniofacial development-domain-containing protein [Cunninghamella echinulata]